jgi:kynurenine formamidase
LGHITKERIHLPDVLMNFHFTAQVITVELVQENGDWVISESSLQHIKWVKTDAIVIRTLPNSVTKKSQIWSGNNPPYFTIGAMQKIVDQGYNHLLTDFPSVDPEEDGGTLAAHRVWWNYPQNPRKNATITELIFVADHIQDGIYLLNIQVPKIHSDAVPSQPVLYNLSELKP